jgi:hypothetical protein
MSRPAGLVAVATLIVAGGMAGATPAICPLPQLKFGPPSGAYAPGNVSADDRHIGWTSGSAEDLSAQSPLTREQIDALIDHLGVFAREQRMKAARELRRAPGTIVLPALIDAASGHADGYVRYRALVLLTGYDDPRVPDQMELAMADVNDRLRVVGYAYFERHPERRLLPVLLKAFDEERSELARRALARTLAAQGADAKVQAALIKDVSAGEDLLRDQVIDAIGDYKGTYAFAAISDPALLDGPMRETVVVALGKLRHGGAMPALVNLQGSALPEQQPLIAAAICLVYPECTSHRELLTGTLKNDDRSERLRAAAAGLGAMAESGDVEAARALIEIGVTAGGSARASAAVALAAFAIQQPALALPRLAERQDRAAAVGLLREGIDMLDDDLAAEQFFVEIRKAYFAEPEESPTRSVIQAVINALEF